MTVRIDVIADPGVGNVDAPIVDRYS